MVTLSDNSKFREFVALFSDNLLISGGNSSAVNYRTEPFTFRYTGFSTTDFSCMLSNQLVGGDPKTPIFTAEVGDKVSQVVLLLRAHRAVGDHPAPVVSGQRLDRVVGIDPRVHSFRRSELRPGRAELDGDHTGGFTAKQR